MRFAPALLAASLAAAGFAATLGAGAPAQASILGLGKAKPVATAAPVLTEAQVALIQRALDEARYVDASTMLDQATAAGIRDPRLTLMGADLWLARGHLDDALAAYKSVESDPALRARSLEGQGVTLAALNKPGEALAMLQRAVAEDPRAWRAWNALGGLYDARHDWGRANEAYDHALADSGPDARVLNNRGYSLLLQKRTDEAVGDFVAALQKKPDLAEARTNLRLAMALKGEYDRATAGGTPAEQAALLNNVGYIAMLRGDYPKAEALFGQAMTAKGDFYAKASANLELARNLQARSLADHAPASAPPAPAEQASAKAPASRSAVSPGAVSPGAASSGAASQGAKTPVKVAGAKP